MIAPPAISGQAAPLPSRPEESTAFSGVKSGPGMRFASIDTIKAIAIFAVICVHSMPFRGYNNTLHGVVDQLCRFAVPFFFMAAGFLIALKIKNSEAPDPFRKYIVRIAALYIAWCIVYLLIPSPRLVSAHGLLQGIYLSACARLSERGDLLVLLGSGTERHLWFFPSLISAIIIVYLFRKPKRRTALLFIAVPLYAAALAAGSYSATPMGIRMDFISRNGPFFSTIYVSLGYLIGSREHRISASAAVAVMLLGIGIHMAEALAMLKFYSTPLARHDFLAGTVLTASGLIMLASAKPGFGKGSFLSMCGKYTLGIYALHYAVDTGLRRLAAPQSGLLWHIAHPVGVFLISLFLVLIAARLPFVKRLVI